MASHFAADGRALLARFDAFFHAADLAAGLSTGFANLRAGSAGFTMKGRVEQHYVRCRAAAFHAGQHDAVMFRLDMRPTFFKAVAGGRVEANAIAIKAGISGLGIFKSSLLRHEVQQAKDGFVPWARSGVFHSRWTFPVQIA